MLRHLIAQNRVNFTPDFNAIPGAGPVQQVINGVGAFALLLALVGIIIGGAMWGVGSLSSKVTVSDDNPPSSPSRYP